jgi:hypothetical protein
MVELPGGGSWDYLQSDVARPHYEDITISGGWQAASICAMEAKLDVLKALRGKRSYLWVADYGGTQIRSRLARCLDVRPKSAQVTSSYCLIDMDFELAAGVWQGAAHTETTALATGTDAITTTNGGNVRVSDAIITVTAVTSSITLLSFYSAGLFHFHYTGTITAGQSLIVNCGTRKVTNNGVGDFAHFILQSDHADNDWLPIMPGVNTFTVARTGGAATSTVKIEYNDGWA